MMILILGFGFLVTLYVVFTLYLRWPELIAYLRRRP